MTSNLSEAQIRTMRKIASEVARGQSQFVLRFDSEAKEACRLLDYATAATLIALHKKGLITFPNVADNDILKAPRSVSIFSQRRSKSDLISYDYFKLTDAGVEYINATFADLMTATKKRVNTREQLEAHNWLGFGERLFNNLHAVVLLTNVFEQMKENGHNPNILTSRFVNASYRRDLTVNYRASDGKWALRLKTDDVTIESRFYGTPHKVTINREIETVYDLELVKMIADAAFAFCEIINLINA